MTNEEKIAQVTAKLIGPRVFAPGNVVRLPTGDLATVLSMVDYGHMVVVKECGSINVHFISPDILEWIRAY